MSAFIMRVEIQQGSQIKYEFKNNSLFVDRIVKLGYPATYGYLENTIAPDGDALDIVLMNGALLQPGSLVKIQPVGYMEMIDNGVKDDKVLAIIQDTQFEEDNDTQFMLKHFFTTYKDGVTVGAIDFDTKGTNKALQAIYQAQKVFK